MRCDYATVRLTRPYDEGGCELQVEDLRHLTTGPLPDAQHHYVKGKLYHLGDDEPGGHLRLAHGGLHLVVTGAYWERPGAFASLPGLVSHASKLLGGATSYTLPRIDWCRDTSISQAKQFFAVGEINRQQDEVAADVLMRAQLVTGKHQWDTSEHQNRAGRTIYLAPAGKDVERMREKSPLIRIYHTTKRPGVLRAEVEVKRQEKACDKPGCDGCEWCEASVQFPSAWARSAALAAAILNDTADQTDVSKFPSGARERDDARVIVARAVGLLLGYCGRMGIAYSSSELDDLDELCYSMLDVRSACRRYRQAPTATKESP